MDVVINFDGVGPYIRVMIRCIAWPPEMSWMLIGALPLDATGTPLWPDVTEFLRRHCFLAFTVRAHACGSFLAHLLRQATAHAHENPAKHTDTCYEWRVRSFDYFHFRFSANTVINGLDRRRATSAGACSSAPDPAGAGVLAEIADLTSPMHV